MKLYLTMIVKGDSDPEHLRRCLLSIIPSVDGLCLVETYAGDIGAIHDVAKEICDEYDAPFFYEMWKDPERHPEHNWISDFSVARNMALGLLPEDATHWCWIDADTEIVNGPLWRVHLDKWVESEQPGVPNVVMQMRYEYDFIGTRCVRETSANMVAKVGYVKWVDPIHEQPVLLKAGGSMFDARGKPYFLRHFKDPGFVAHSSARNLWVLEHYAETHDGGLPVHLAVHMAAAHLSVGNTAAAIAGFRDVVATGELTDEQQYYALIRLGTTEMFEGMYDAALATYGRAVSMYPARATPWCYMASLYNRLGRYDDALIAARRAEEFRGAPEGLSHNPSHVMLSPYQAQARALEGLGNPEAAMGAYKALLVESKDQDDLGVRAEMERLQGLLDERETYAAFKRVADVAGPHVWGQAPDELEVYPEVAKARLPERPSDRETVMLYCGSHDHPWGPSDLDSGIGGSEEAVIFLSRELVRQGFHVEVYAQPKRGEMGPDPYGVVWAPHYAWEDKPGIFVSWRGWRAPRYATKARLRFSWVHDIVLPHEFPETEAPFIDGVFCLSQHQAKGLLASDVWSQKVILTENGLSPDYFVDGLSRRSWSFGFYSSPDRGLEPLLKQWGKIRYALPDARLDIYYGFTNYYIEKMKRIPHLRDFKLKMEAMLRDCEHMGVSMHGMVGQRELAYSMASTAFWLYPSDFQETSCITAMKAQALGCIPITSRHRESAIPETCRYDLGPPSREGSIASDEGWLNEWTDRVIEVARLPDDQLPFTRAEMMRWARETFSWEKVARQWGSIFRSSGASQPESRDLHLVS